MSVAIARTRSESEEDVAHERRHREDSERERGGLAIQKIVGLRWLWIASLRSQ